ncbi:MAG: hypothetical protein AB8B64_14105 [Granulosicoccus sp.]
MFVQAWYTGCIYGSAASFINRVVVIRLLIIVVALLYPFIIYFGIAHFSPGILAGLLAAIVTMRVSMSDLTPVLKSLAVAAVVVVFMLHWWLKGGTDSLRYYPVVLNGVLLITFGLSLFKEQSLIEAIARKRGMDVGAHNLHYLRVLTAVWTVFFALSFVTSYLTVIYGDMDIWLLYNGLGSYLLMGLLVVGELIVRHFYRQRINRTS